jgi:hypothetical protein
MINKLYKGNLVAVLISPSYGAGWSTWGTPNMAFDGELAQAILNDLPNSELLKIASKNWPNAHTGGLYNLEIVWVKQGTQFIIDEYDGYESLEFKDEFNWLTA